MSRAISTSPLPKCYLSLLHQVHQASWFIHHPPRISLQLRPIKPGHHTSSNCRHRGPSPLRSTCHRRRPRTPHCSALEGRKQAPTNHVSNPGLNARGNRSCDYSISQSHPTRGDDSGGAGDQPATGPKLPNPAAARAGAVTTAGTAATSRPLPTKAPPATFLGFLAA